MEIKHEVISRPKYGADADICTFYLLENNHWIAFGNGIIYKESGLMQVISCTCTSAKKALDEYVRDYNE